MQNKTILIVDDEQPIREMVKIALDLAGFNCLEAENAQAAHSLIIDESPDLVLLDWMMPGTSGIELLRRLRRDELTLKLPVIMLTARAAEDNVIQGLDVGADDYLVKPFSPRELVARINAQLRRQQPSIAEEELTAGRLLLDPSSHRVSIGDTPVTMGPTEYRLLAFFLSHQERVYSRDQIIDHVWGGNIYVDERTVDVHIRRLRKALSPEGHDRCVQTVRGAGYRFSTKGVELAVAD